MKTTIHILGAEASIEQGEWTCADPLILKILRVEASIAPPASGADPDHDHTEALRLCKLYPGARITAWTPEEMVDGRIY